MRSNVTQEAARRWKQGRTENLSGFATPRAPSTRFVCKYFISKHFLQLQDILLIHIMNYQTTVPDEKLLCVDLQICGTIIDASFDPLGCVPNENFKAVAVVLTALPHGCWCNHGGKTHDSDGDRQAAPSMSGQGR